MRSSRSVVSYILLYVVSGVLVMWVSGSATRIFSNLFRSAGQQSDTSQVAGLVSIGSLVISMGAAAVFYLLGPILFALAPQLWIEDDKSKFVEKRPLTLVAAVSTLIILLIGFWYLALWSASLNWTSRDSGSDFLLGYRIVNIIVIGFINVMAFRAYWKSVGAPAPAPSESTDSSTASQEEVS